MLISIFDNKKYVGDARSKFLSSNVPEYNFYYNNNQQY